MDAGPDAGREAGPDAGPHTGIDAGPDAGGCYPGTTWVGDICVAFSCADYPFVASCFRDDGSLGNCVGGHCTGYSEGTDDCGAFGIDCPPPTSCVGGYCVWENDAGQLFGPFCDQPCADPTQVCLEIAGCVKASCAPEDDSQACQTSNEDFPVGFCCHGACLMESDDQDCGACGRSCGSVGVCVLDPYYRGYCVPARASCTRPADFDTTSCVLPSGGAGACCGDTCVDLTNDPENCQGCGIECPDGILCPPGGCAGCNRPSKCSAGKECTDLGCLSPCTPATEGWVCVLDGGLSGTCCSSACVDTATDPRNCVGCGLACDAGQFCGYGCSNYQACASVPFGTYAPCATDAGGPGQCCGLACVDTNADSLNCGGCELQCPEGSTCSEGVCFEKGQVTYCSSDGGCPEGTGCAESDFTCAPGTCDGIAPSCVLDAGPGTCCGSTCVPWADFWGCGVICPLGATLFLPSFLPSPPLCERLDGGAACDPGAVCPAGTECDPFDQACEYLRDCSLAQVEVGGRTGCAFGTTSGTCCGDACVDISQDPANCGACGNVCPSGMCTTLGCVPVGPTSDCLVTCALGSYCQNGQCAISCNGQPFCLAEDGTVGSCCSSIDSLILDFTCAHLLDDPQNCGSCGNACAAGQACRDGACSGAPRCPNGREYAFCDLDAGPSFVCCPSIGCTDTARDPLNCGRCGVACRSGTSCVDGQCG